MQDDWCCEERPEQERVSLSVENFKLDGDRHQDLRLPNVAFPVRVLDPDGEPVAGAWVKGETDPSHYLDTDAELFPGAKTKGYSLSDKRTDTTGTATLRFLAGAFPATISVVPPGGRGLRAVVPISPTATAAEVRLDDGPTLRGRIQQADGQAAGWAHGDLIPQSGPAYPFTWGPDGAYIVSAPPGRYRIALDNRYPQEGESNDWSVWNLSSDQFELNDDKTLDLTIPGGGARLRAVDVNGVPINDLGEGASSSSIAKFELAPGLKASSNAWISGMGTFDELELPVLAPSRLDRPLRLRSDDSDIPDVDFAGPYVAPGEDTVIAYTTAGRRTASGPQEVQAVSRPDGSASVTWKPPADDGASPVIAYLVRSTGWPTRQAYVKAPSTAALVTGLPVGRELSFWVWTITARGLGGSTESWPLTVQAVTEPSPGTTPTSTTPPTTQTPTSQNPTTQNSTTTPAGPTDLPAAARSGYWMLGSDGHVYAFGGAADHGTPSAALGSARAVDLEPTPTGDGYWVLDGAGRVSAHGDARPLGNVDRSTLGAGEIPTSLSATPTGKGYWVFTDRGRAIPFGDAAFLGDMAGSPLNGAVLDSVATPSGRGYYMVASDGGIFAFGDAVFAGSMGGQRLNAPVESLVPDGDGSGYWLVASDGGIFAFDAPFRGSMGGKRLNKPVTGMVRYGNGYLMVAEDGGIFNFSDLAFAGSLGDYPPVRPIVSVATLTAPRTG